jgi:replication protein
VRSIQKLYAVNAQLADSLNSLDSDYARLQSRRMRTCSHGIDGSPISHCKSPLCLMCRRWKCQCDNRILRLRVQSVQSKYPRAKFLFGTFAAADAGSNSIRTVARKVSTSWHRVMQQVHGLVGAFRSIEISPSRINSSLESPHLHSLLAVGPGYSGRYYLSNRAWHKHWQNEIGELARRGEDSGVRVEAVDDLEAVMDYIVPWTCEGKKGFLRTGEEAVEDPIRYVEQANELRGLSSYKYLGELRGSQLEEDHNLTGLYTFLRNRSKRRTFERQVARIVNPKSNRPLQLLPVGN